jgi:hypothetical protein
MFITVRNHNMGELSFDSVPVLPLQCVENVGTSETLLKVTQN